MPPMISIAAVTKRYKSGLVALDAVDLEIAKGEIFALLGPNGAGKTTLIGVICGTVSMTSGRVLVDGHDVVARISRRALEGGPGAAGDRARHFLHGLETVRFSRRPVRPPRRSDLTSSSCCATSRSGRSATPASSSCPAA